MLKAINCQLFLQISIIKQCSLPYRAIIYEFAITELLIPIPNRTCSLKILQIK